MGWASGSYIAENLWKQLKRLVHKEAWPKMSRIIYEVFADYDADDFSFEQDEDCLYYMYLKLNKPKELETILEEYSD